VGFVRRHPVIVSAFAIGSTIIVILAVTAIAVWEAAHQDDARRVDHADVIAVLGAAQYNGRPSPIFEGRLRQGALLYQKGFAPRVLVLGGGKPGDRTTEADSGRAWLLANGLPDQAVYAEPEGNTTLQSLQAAAAWMAQRDFRTVFLVSDPWHNLRIKRMASDLGMTPMVSATFHSAARSQWTRLNGYTRETFAYLAYRILGR